MKIEKYMLETAKALLKEKNVMICEYEDSIVVSNDGYFAMFVPREKFIFNAEPKGAFTGMLPRGWESHEMRYTDTCEERYTNIYKYGGKKLYHVLESVSGGWKTLIDEKFLKYLDINTDVKFYQPYENAAVVVTEGGKLCAIIMPIVKSEVK
ncbi:hypothetical protein [Ruminococcus callidus]|uniref:hypothetical protein n=1 Tax=Ruminococcus callidus TaxID=40519 RepID=UPI0035224FB0